MKDGPDCHCGKTATLCTTYDGYYYVECFECKKKSKLYGTTFLALSDWYAELSKLLAEDNKTHVQTLILNVHKSITTCNT